MNYLKRLLPYLKPHRKALMLAMLCMLLAGVLSGAFLFLFEKVLRQILKSTSPTRFSQLNFFMVLAMVWAVVRGLVDFTQSYVMQRTWQRILNQLRLDLYTHFQNLSVRFFE